MYQREVVPLDNRRQTTQVGDIFGAQLLRCPADGVSGLGIEQVDIQLTDSCQVMVAGNRDVFTLLQELQALAGVGPIADDIPQAPQFINRRVALNIAQDGSKGSQIGVYIG